MQMKKTIITLVIAVVALSPMTVGATDDPTSELYRGLFQVVKSLPKNWAFNAAIGGAIGTEYELAPGLNYGNSVSLVLVPVGFQYMLSKNFTVQSYLFMLDEVGREFISEDEHLDQPYQLEIRPVVGLTFRANISSSFEIGALARYEARFKDATHDGSFENRFRLRPYIDYTFGEDAEAGTYWRVKAEFEPKYVISSEKSLLNALQARATIGHSFSKSLSVDLRYVHEWGKSDSDADWTDSFDSIFVQFTVRLGKQNIKPMVVDD